MEDVEESRHGDTRATILQVLNVRVVECVEEVVVGKIKSHDGHVDDI